MPWRNLDLMERIFAGLIGLLLVALLAILIIVAVLAWTALVEFLF